jgi:hypothetical protein
MKRTFLSFVTVIALSLAATSAEAAFFVTVTLPSAGSGAFAGATLTAYDNNTPGPNAVVADDNLDPDIIHFEKAVSGKYDVAGTFRLQTIGDTVTLLVEAFSIRNKLPGSTQTISAANAMANVQLLLHADGLTLPANPTSLVSSLTVSSGVSNATTLTLTSTFSDPNVNVSVSTMVPGDIPVTVSDYANLTPGTGPYTLTALYNIASLGGNKTYDLDGSFTSIGTPEPASLAAWGGMGLFGLVMAARRRRAIPECCG